MFRETARGINFRFMSGEISAEEITRYFLKRIRLGDGAVGSILALLEEGALAQARELDHRKSRGDKLGPLAGTPILIKDNIHICGEKTTCASRFLEHFVAPFDAFVVTKLREAGAIFIAKANLDEFAMGSSTENSAFQKSYNPWDLERIPGGSSGGSAAGVSAMFAPLSLGSDTGGSIRQPAGLTNLYGFRPTYGRVSRYGLVSFGSSLDQIGPFARDIDDLILLQEVLAHHCPLDSTSLANAHEPLLTKDTSLQGKRLGVAFELLDRVDSDVSEVYHNAVETFQELGCEIVPVSMAFLEYAIPTYYVLSSAEASTNLARFDGVRYGRRSPDARELEEVYRLSRMEGFGPEVKQRIFLGTFVLSSGFKEAYFQKAQKVRRLISEEHKALFERCDMLLLPTTPTPAFKAGEITDPVHMYLQDLFTSSGPLVGCPSLSFPAGFSKTGLPIGLQLEGPLMGDRETLRFARAFQEVTPFASKSPPAFDKEFA